MKEKITVGDIKEIIDLVRTDANIEWFVFKEGDVEISLSRNGIPGQTAETILPSVASQPVLAPAPVLQQPVVAASPAAPVASPAVAVLAPRDIEIKAPMVGTFYRRPKPGADPFIEVGGTVKPGDTLCIVEVMKLMNSVKVDTAGTVKSILVEDGQPVEYGQVLMVIGGSQ